MTENHKKKKKKKKKTLGKPKLVPRFAAGTSKKKKKKTLKSRKVSMGLKLGPCTRKSKVLPWSHARRTFSLPSTVHNFRPQISFYNHFRRHFTPTILIHCLRMRAHNELETIYQHRLITLIGRKTRITQQTLFIQYTFSIQ